MTIVNYDSKVITKLEISLTDDARVVIYDRHMFMVQATGLYPFHFLCNLQTDPKKLELLSPASLPSLM
jgi:hypothetical protein